MKMNELMVSRAFFNNALGSAFGRGLSCSVNQGRDIFHAIR